MKKIILTLIISQVAVTLNSMNPEDIELRDFKEILETKAERVLNKQKELNLKLLNANTIEEAQQALKDGADINCRCDNGATSLWDILYSSKSELAMFLISQGADINAKHKGLSMIDAALGGGVFDIALLLIQKGVNVNNNAKTSTLMYAVDSNHTNIVKKLLEKGANPNIQDYYYGRTPLIFAILLLRDNFDIIKLLVYNKTNLNIKNQDGETALDIAKEYNRQDIVQFLENYIAVQEQMGNMLDKIERPIITSKILELTNLNKDVANIISDYWCSINESEESDGAVYA